ncbi:LysM peptidoglycan-binding domain-containing protein [Haloferula sp.]|uniref:LysM peptidoglycan-binding domain-containing protein n=1 Tax=Haloferula sp. TaxID=2497595 RepID=UPI0032A00A40
MNPATSILLISLITLACRAAEPTETERQLREQERQIKQLETENSRLRWLLQKGDQATTGDPLYGVSGQESTGEQVYIVRAGDSLSRIARITGASPEALASHNKLEDPQLIHANQELRIPPESTAPEPRKSLNPPLIHTVQAGENLYRIALSHGMELDQLLAKNPGIEPLSLKVGQQVKVSPARKSGDHGVHPLSSTLQTGASPQG